ncbi:MAG: hypothetical protein ACTSRI_02690 [Promethearchaeota archaeon]
MSIEKIINDINAEIICCEIEKSCSFPSRKINKQQVKKILKQNTKYKKFKKFKKGEKK